VNLPSVWGIHDAQDENSPEPLPTGCGFYRIVLPLEQYKANGGQAHWQAFWAPELDDPKWDIIIGERFDRPHMLGAWRRLAQKHKLAYELDDNIWAVDPANVNAYRSYSRYATQDAAEASIAVCDLVIVSTGPLAEVIRQRTGHSNVVVCPNYVPAANLAIGRQRNDTVTLGWTGGVSHTWDVALIATTVAKVLDRNRHVSLHVQGSDFRPTFGGLRHQPRMRWTNWVPSPRDYYPLLDFDIGLAPLASSEFNESKSYLKPLEYASLGIPCIASDETAYRDFIRDGETGFLVSGRKQWQDRMELLIHDQGLRETMGAKARALAAGYTIESNWHKWAAAFKGIM
jgi:glycosyltransferase involved in cell wall biosynthesis